MNSKALGKVEEGCPFEHRAGARNALERTKFAGGTSSGRLPFISFTKIVGHSFSIHHSEFCIPRAALTPPRGASTFRWMAARLPRFILVLVSLAALSGGCDSEPVTPVSNMFAPTGMRIHPIFTQIQLDKDNKPTGIEAQLEFQDQFGDPTKAGGTVMFELFEYRQDSPDPRGKRLGGPWIGSLATRGEQQERWNTTLRTYRFELTDANIRTDVPYVLTAIFELSSGGRFFDRSILPGKKAETKPSERSSIFPSFETEHASPPSSQP